MDYRILVLALGTFAIGTDNYVVAGILPQVAQSFGVDIAAAGQFVTVYALAYGLLTPVAATVTASWPRRQVLAIGLLVFIAGNVLTATQASFGLALLSRAVAGLGGAMFTPAAGAAAAAMVLPERRGTALAIVVAGLSGATALGAPIGTLVGHAGDWHMTMWFVAVLGLLALAGLLAVLPQVALPPALGLRARLAPLGDVRVAAVLLTTFLMMFGVFLVYTYISAVFEEATTQDGARLAALLSGWGIAATLGNLAAGRLSDRWGSRRVINAALAVAAVDFALMPWSGATFPGALVAVAIWGFCGWGFVVAQQHRLTGIMPALTPILLALNASAIYLAVSAAGGFGALLIGWMNVHHLPVLTAVLVLAALVPAELAYRQVGAGEGKA